ncbi:hypothetical protein GCM10012278_27530 [Nonomuraea glycinis]|uniref:Uncharacterized protein n=1 Tax=Nonomuraea glycinis TaxID=2047744 RepID=A0A918A3E3_9ACTN|nr:hypothetical protein GCM10012278_27530 [Nonomuraea glycinis]
MVHRPDGRKGLAGEDDPAEWHASQAPQRLFLGQVLELPQARRAGFHHAILPVARASVTGTKVPSFPEVVVREGGLRVREVSFRDGGSREVSFREVGLREVSFRELGLREVERGTRSRS